ncbi:uncharacterized protein BDV14DRAFT_195363 [Aspergillus stella-maris]|uniref:uncharacterized protein n=1 Tax=Aspergillus stella-maris TaxID=1810926 RepID=UPI003CCE2A70
MNVPFKDVHIAFISGNHMAGDAIMSIFNQKSRLRRGPEGDPNIYITGLLGQHAVVHTLSPIGSPGSTSLVITLHHMKRSFPNLRVLIVVGHATGAPDITALPNSDIRLGDVVVGVPTAKNAAGVKVINYIDDITQQTVLRAPQNFLLDALARVHKDNSPDGAASISEYVDDLIKSGEAPWLVDHGIDYRRPEQATDRLFRTGYKHVKEKTCWEEPCTDCDTSEVVRREARAHRNPVVHLGQIAAFPAGVESPALRDRVKAEAGSICIEGDMTCLSASSPPVFAIRGISDYGDSHNNPMWARYACLTAAALARQVLLGISKEEIAVQKRLVEDYGGDW